MTQKKSLLWSILLPVSLVFCAGAYYVRRPDFRAWVDARTPLARTYLGRFVEEPVQRIVMQREMDPMFARTPAPMVRPPEHEPVRLPPAPAPATPQPPLPMDLDSLAKDPARWPKTVTLKKPVTFPAVLNGKIVGSLVAPAGEEVELKAIKDEKLGLVFNGAGAYVPPEETDFFSRLQPR